MATTAATTGARGGSSTGQAAGANPPSSADAILMHQAGFPNIRIRGTTSSGRPQLYFQPDGRSPGANLTLRICADGREHSRIIVSNSGRVRSTRTRTDRPC
ncbi:GspH/FimT family protein [Stenotrophomonas sp. Sm10]|uniref:GspH/FimT family protein n=1 Tax=Stenotrophomonas sp. Sm10 TaxID=3002754 RepID=UPI0031F33513